METTADIGVIVGRFQVHKLHEAHREIIDQVVELHKKVIVMLGTTSVLVTKRNPLDFVARKEMILQEYPTVTVLSIPDVPSDTEWSKMLDDRIREVFPIGEVVLYGSRDSFIQYYSGVFQTKELTPHIFISGTEVRTEVSKEVKKSEDFRAGVIYAAYNQYKKVHPTIDVAIFKNNRILLGKKANSTKYRFIGGFVDTQDESYEDAVMREAYEETGITLQNISYIGSCRIDDWRYRNESDKIITMFFRAEYKDGSIEPMDDIYELKFFELEQLHQSIFVEEHQPLATMLLQSINNSGEGKYENE